MSQPTRILSRTARSLRWPPPISHTTTRTFQAQNVFQNDSASISRTDSSIKGTPSDPKLSENKPLSFTPTLPTFSLAGKVAVITGGARGLGLAMSQALVMSGADLAIVDINKENATQAALEITELFQKTYPDQPKPNITAHYADISLISDVESSVTDIISKHGRIDNLVACAGFCENVAAVEMKPERLRRLLSVNVEGTFFYATAVARHLMERKAPGNMVFIGSISGSIVNVPQPQAVYNASKAAVRHLGASLAVEWAEKGIRVNVLSPGYMLTEIALNSKILVDNPGLRTRWEASIPQGKMGAPDTLMGAVTFLSSDASAYITGQEIKVDGGYTVC